MLQTKVDAITLEALHELDFDENVIEPTVYNVQDWLSNEKGICIIVSPFWGINGRKYNYRIRRKYTEIGPWFSQYENNDDAWRDGIKAALIAPVYDNALLATKLNDSMLFPIEETVDDGKYSIPSLLQRLTDDEAQKVRDTYNISKRIVEMENEGTMMYSMHTQIMCVLENIFGQEMFE